MISITQTSITIDGRGGFPLELDFFTDDMVTPRDVSAAAMFFEVDGALRVPLGAGIASNQRTLSLARDQIAQIGIKYRDFAFIDESGPIADAFWTGVITVKGFIAQPAS